MRELQAQVAMLREALLIGRARTMDDINGAREAKDDAIADLVIINKTLAATKSTEAEYRRQIENEALERAQELAKTSQAICDHITDHPTADFDIPDEIYIPWVDAIRAMKG
jgi:hypothetical protein